MKTILTLALLAVVLAACSPTTTAYDQSGYASCTGWFCSARVENTVYDGSSLAMAAALICLLAAGAVAVIATATNR
jgi:hypothetical protein